MPKPVKLPKNKEFQFKSASGAASKYAWDEWFNGDLLMLERSVYDGGGALKEKKDYDVETDAMAPKIKTAARRRYKVVQISRLDADGNKLKDALIIKARPMMEDEKQAEDLKRAEEKAARAEAGESDPTPGETEAA